MNRVEERADMEPVLLKAPIDLPREDQVNSANGLLTYAEEFKDQGFQDSLNSASSCHNKKVEEDGCLLQTQDSTSSETSQIQHPNDASEAVIRQDFGACNLGGEIQGLRCQANALWRRTEKLSKVNREAELVFIQQASVLTGGDAEISYSEEELQWKEEVIMELENAIAELREVVDRLEEVKKRQVGKLEMGDGLATSTSKNEGEELVGDCRQLRIGHQELPTQPEQHEKEWSADADELIYLQWVNGA